jgi:methionyl-tRNA formyltransferase
MGTPEIAVPVLAALIEAGHDIVCVYSQPPRPTGRGHREQPSPVHAFAEARGILVRTPQKLTDEAVAFGALNADAAIVIAYGLILPLAILEAPRLGCINVHVSLLPRWRGAAPIQRAIIAGDEITGVTIMAMDEGLDTGPVLDQKTIPITGETTAESLHDELAALGAKTLPAVLDAFSSGELTPRPQPDDGACYAKKLSRDEGRIDWDQDADLIERKIRALNPWPGTWFEHEGARIRVREAEVEDADGVPGTVLDDAALIACGAGALRLLRLQRPGKAVVDAASFLRGYALARGTVLGSDPS